MLGEFLNRQANLDHLLTSTRIESNKSRFVLSAVLVAAIWCFYRLAVFTPQPLDFPGTLRPIFNGWLIGFINHNHSPELAYARWKTFCFFLLLVPPSLAVFAVAIESKLLNLPGRVAGLLCSRTLFLTSIATSLAVCRFPTLVRFELNPDEGGYLAAAQKLFYDGNFFRAVDCGTSGPLNVYPLMLPAILCISPDFASTRVLVLVILFLIIYLLYRTVSLLASDAISRIAVLPLVAAFSTFQNPNLLHYSSEHVPMLLVGIAFYASVRIFCEPSRHSRFLLLLGLLISAGFLSKMQSLPILAALAAVSLTCVHFAGNAGKLWRPSMLVICGTLPLLLISTALCLSGRVSKDFWMSYIVTNQVYSEIGNNFVTQLPIFLQFSIGTIEVRLFLFTFLALTLAYVASAPRRDPADEQSSFLRLVFISFAVIALSLSLYSAQLTAGSSYLTLLILFSAPMYLLLFGKTGGVGADPKRWFGILSLAATAAAVFSAYKPHRTFPHYLLFLFTPLCAAMAWILMERTGDRKPGPNTGGPDLLTEGRNPLRLAFSLLFVVLSVTYQTFVWGAQDAGLFSDVVQTIRPLEGDFIRSITKSGERIVVWGWSVDPYLGSGRVAGTRDLNMLDFFGPEQIGAYYRARFLSDLQKEPAALFIDAVGPNSWSLQDPNAFGFQQFADIAAFVEHNYIHLTNAYDHHYFLRKDLASRVQGIKLPRLCAPDALRCVDMPARTFVEGATTLAVKNLPSVEMPFHALIEADFTPVALQTANATVFNNEAVPHSFRGFRFQSIGANRYQLILGTGENWEFSQPMFLPPGRLARLSIEINGTDVFLRCNGTGVDRMHLPSRMADTAGPITVGSWIDGWCRFSGTIQFFQILDRT